MFCGMLGCGTRMGFLGSFGVSGCWCSLLLPYRAKFPQIPADIAVSGGWDCPLCCDMGTTKGREIYSNWEHFPRTGAGRVVAAWHFHCFLLLHPFFYSCLGLLPKGPPAPALPSEPKPEVGPCWDSSLLKITLSAHLQQHWAWGWIFPVAGDL